MYKLGCISAVIILLSLLHVAILEEKVLTA